MWRHLAEARIKALATEVVALPLDDPFEGTALGSITSVTSLLVEILTEEGLTGFGHLTWYNARSGAQIASVRALVEDLGQWLVGQDGSRRAALYQGMRRLTLESLHAGITTIAIGTIDIALWDLSAKHLGVPVSLLLGGLRDEIDAYESGRLTKSALTDLEREAESIRAQGFHAAKMSAGARPLREDVKRVAAVRRALGDEARLMVDCGRRLSPSAAVEFARAVRDYNIFWLEDPVAQTDIAGHRWVREHGGIPVATGERISSFAELDAILSAQAADHVMLNLHRVGGPSAWLPLAQHTAFHHTPLSTHGAHEFQRHLLAAQPNACHVEYHNWWNRLYADPPMPVNGVLKIGPEPGFGAAPDRKAIQRYRLG